MATEPSPAARSNRRLLGGKRLDFTFDRDLRRGFNHSQRRHGHAGVVSRLADVGKFQNVASNGHFVFFGELGVSGHPLDKGHGGPNGNAGEISVAPWHHLLIAGWDGETGRHPPYWNT